MRIFAIAFLWLALGGIAHAQESGKAWLGAGVVPVTEQEARALNWPAPVGVKVKFVADPSPARAAGLLPGDIITMIGPLPVTNLRVFLAALASMQPGAKLAILVFRGGQRGTLAVTLGQQPPADAAQRTAGTPAPKAGKTEGPPAAASKARQSSGQTGRKAWLGVSVTAASGREVAEQGGGVFGGVKVKSVTDGSPAQSADLLPEDIIVRIGANPVPDTRAFMAELAKRKPGARLTLTLVRGGKRKTMAVMLGEQPLPAEAPKPAEAPVDQPAPGPAAAAEARAPATGASPPPAEPFDAPQAELKNERILEWFVTSGVRELPALLEAQFEEGRKSGQADERTAKAAKDAISRAFEPGKVLRFLDDGLQKLLTAGERGEVLAFCDSPLGKRMEQLQQAAENPKDKERAAEEMKAFAANPAAFADRAQLYRDLDDAAGLTQAKIDVGVNLLAAVKTGMMIALQRPEKVSFEAIRAEMVQLTEPARMEAAEATVAETAYQLQPLNEQELKAAITFFKSPAAQKFLAIQRKLLGDAIAGASEEFGQHFIRGIAGKDNRQLETLRARTAMFEQIRELEKAGRYKESLEISERLFALTEGAYGKDDPYTLRALNYILKYYIMFNRASEVEAIYQRALQSDLRLLGKESVDTLTLFDMLAMFLTGQGRYNEAESFAKRALEAHERILGKQHPTTLSSAFVLAAVYSNQKRYSEAEPIYKRILEDIEKMPAYEKILSNLSFGDLSKDIVLAALASIYSYQNRTGEAEQLLKQALDDADRSFGREHPTTTQILSNLAAVYQGQKRFKEAEDLYNSALNATERHFGRENGRTLQIAAKIAMLYAQQGFYGEGELFLKRVLATQERVLGNEHQDVLVSLHHLADLYLFQHNWDAAADCLKRITKTISRRAILSGKGDESFGSEWDQLNATANVSGVEQYSLQFRLLIKAMSRIPAPENAPGQALREMFENAQWALSSEAAQSLAQMAARTASGDPRMKGLVRERQDLNGEWQYRNAQRDAAFGKGASERNPAAEKENQERIGAVEALIAEIDRQLASQFPEYASLTSPAPLTVEDVQALLNRDEVLVLFLDTGMWSQVPEETFVWVVTKTDARWVRTRLGAAALTREVQALRCGLDAAAWQEPRCAELTGKSYTDAGGEAGNPLPFDHARAHALYKELFGQVQDLIQGKHLLLAPSGPLTQLPFQALLTAPSTDGDNRGAAWLARDHAITILPAVSSLKALRQVARPSAATRPMIGFGNPLLDGYDQRGKVRAQYAQQIKACESPALQRLASVMGLPRAVRGMERRSAADTSLIRAQDPLPETANELCAVARNLRADPGDIRLGERATETEVKALNASGELAQYRVAHFATHGVMAGQMQGTAEPGLIMTPPAEATAEDDGYLSASEIAGLKLDADWVILSACNTAAGNAEGAQALSGLARAFIYAQARALLVSHWAVNSAATVKLVSGAMQEMAGDARVGRAEAFRRSMLALIGKGEAHEAHPAYWAPFIVVGEGAR